MTHRRWISLVTLLAFLPMAAGCSVSRTMRIDADPSESESAARFQAGEAIEIDGYTRPDDGFREWRGFVQTIPPDSLQFSQKREYRKPAPEPPFRLARADVVSVAAREFSSGKTTGLVFGMLLVVGVIVAAIIGNQLSKDIEGLGNWSI